MIQPNANFNLNNLHYDQQRSSFRMMTNRALNGFEPVIGLEVHVQLQTRSKCFCACKNVFGGSPNSNVCPVCLGLPGALPVMNREAVRLAIKAALAFGGEIHTNSVFARKNYFYPDLPKGYQISQFSEPFATGGSIPINTNGDVKQVALIRIHLEEDAGKSVHSKTDRVSHIDLNRCGVPLIEIVSQPELRSPEEAHRYLERLKQILLYTKVSDCNMEEGSLRCDANVSVRKSGSDKFGTRTELKNLNSFKAVQKALQFEIRRQVDLIMEGQSVSQETLLWDENRNEARSMRSKEDAHDYRYFPDPDLLPLSISAEEIEEIRTSLPELPINKERRFVETYQLPAYDAMVLTTTPELADYFENTAKLIQNSKQVSNWIMGDVLAMINDRGINITEFAVKPKDLASLIRLINEGDISAKIAKAVFREMVDSGKAAPAIVREQGLVQITDTDQIESVIDEVLRENGKEVDRYLSGEDKLLGFFVGRTMKLTHGKANPKLVNELLKKKLVPAK